MRAAVSTDTCLLELSLRVGERPRPRLEERALALPLAAPPRPGTRPSYPQSISRAARGTHSLKLFSLGTRQ